MSNFPYLKLTKKAYQFTVQNPWLWLFGLFIGGFSGQAFGGSNFSTPAPEMPEPLSFDMLKSQIEAWIGLNSLEIASLILFGFSVLIIFLILQGVSKGAVIWSAGQLSSPKDKSDQEGVGFKIAIKRSKQYFSKIIGLQFILSIASVLLLIIFTGPIVYFFFIGARGYAVALMVLGLVLFIPAMVIFAFSFVFGPIFIVLFNQKVKQAIVLSIKLIKKKFREAIVVAVLLWLIAIAVLIIAGLLFALFSFLGVVLAVVSAQGDSTLPSMILFFGPILIGIICVIVLESAFAVFYQIVWVLAVKEMTGAVLMDEESEEYIPEPAS